jgi:RNA polymerase sigma-70 factor (ECF subfamily)
MEIEDIYITYRPLLFSIAYRMLGTVTDAEDMVHNALLSAQSLEIENIDHVKAYLSKMVTNQCIDYLKSARHQREVYIGPWLPEPLEINKDNDPLHQIEKDHSISMAMLLVMEQLSPIERAIFILREAFSYEYNDISVIVGKSEANCRKILSRAKQKIRPQESNTPVSIQRSEELAKQFIMASSTGNIDQLIHLLAEDVVLYSDGGGRVKAAIHPIISRDRVVQFLVGMVKMLRAQVSPTEIEGTVKFANINGQTGIIMTEGNGLSNVICFNIQGNEIKQLFIIRNPEKLKHLSSSYEGA